MFCEKIIAKKNEIEELRIFKHILVILFAVFPVFESYSQDLEPHLISALPTGGNFLIASYSHSNGNILVDNTIPIDNLDANLNNIVVAYARSFKLFNKLTKFDAILPYSFAAFSGVVSQIDSSTSRNGFADPLFRISMILIGTKPLTPADFFKREVKKFNLGVSFRLRIPTGQYFSDKLLNLGANRWAFKIGAAASYGFFKNKLILEAHLFSWFFTENKSFFNGNTLGQKPVVVAQAHISYTFKPGVWLAFSVGRSGLGMTVLNGEVLEDQKQNNGRFGGAFAFRITKGHALKIAYTSGVSTRYGADFNTLLIAYQFMWFDKDKKNNSE